ncbi:MAG: DUF2723 domain-containing protein [Deltaproteobacteria bacterium]|nr:DUF2723 domain-containing protein [Deltaproteobacteria bacterium]
MKADKVSLFRGSETAALVGLGCFGVYLLTACPTVYLGDSGEFTASAFCLGIPHNSGYPLYSLLGKIFCLIPFGNVGFRMNLMSAATSALAVALLYEHVFRITGSKISSFVAAGIVGFTPLFWMQAVCAEVYALHGLFLVLMIRILWWWDERREFRGLLLFAFVVGLSFGNHMQTVMLAPAVLFLVFYTEMRTFFAPGRLGPLCLLFLLALTIYVYLPVRTEAGAAITWGDPNTLDRFLSHVTARTHRAGYVMTRSWGEYAARAGEALSMVGAEFGLALVFSVWGWAKGLNPKWRIFFVLLVFFDFVYTVFLNIISLEITAFAFPTAVSLAILAGLGIADFLGRIRSSARIGKGVGKALQGAFCLIPLIVLGFNYDRCDQGRNFTGYEHAANILRTPENQAVLLIDGDNYVFPVIYARLVEGMGEQVRILDRFNLVFKWPETRRADASGGPDRSVGPVVESVIRENAARGVYLAVFDPHAFPVPDSFDLVPHGMLLRVAERGAPIPLEQIRKVWSRYSTHSFYEDMERDYMNRQVCGYFHFNRGRFFLQAGLEEKGLEAMRLASRTAYNDEMIHSDIGVFLTGRGFFQDAGRELEKALLYSDDRSAVYNNFGYYYDAMGDQDKALASFRKAVEINPHNTISLNNLGFALLKSGRKAEALASWKRSLRIRGHQPEIESLVRAVNSHKPHGE